MKKRFLKIIMSVLTVAILLNLFTGCNSITIPNANAAYVSLSINPLVEFVVNDSNIVIAVNCANEDAEILLAETDLTGKTLEEASQIFVALATEAGYIDVESEDNQVTVTVISGSEDTQKEENIKNLIINRINKYFENNGIFGRVSVETMETFGEQIDALDVPLGKKKMIARALDMDPSLDIEVLKDMSMKDLMSIFKDKIKDGLDNTIRNEYKGEREALREEYRLALTQMFETAKAGLEAEFAAMFALETDIAALNEQLSVFEGTTEDRVDLELELQDKIAAYEILKAEFDVKMDELENAYENKTGLYADKIAEFEQALKELNESFRTQRDELREQHKQQIRQRIEEHKNKIQQHREQIKDRINEIKENIQNWRKGKN